MSPRNGDVIYSADSINQVPISPEFEQLLINYIAFDWLGLSVVFGRGRPSSGLTGIINFPGFFVITRSLNVFPQSYTFITIVISQNPGSSDVWRAGFESKPNHPGR
jgi:hypothetical protein